jgi:hypothetical protein
VLLACNYMNVIADLSGYDQEIMSYTLKVSQSHMFGFYTSFTMILLPRCEHCLSVHFVKGRCFVGMSSDNLCCFHSPARHYSCL